MKKNRQIAQKYIYLFINYLYIINTNILIHKTLYNYLYIYNYLR